MVLFVPVHSDTLSAAGSTRRCIVASVPVLIRRKMSNYSLMLTFVM